MGKGQSPNNRILFCVVTVKRVQISIVCVFHLRSERCQEVSDCFGSGHDQLIFTSCSADSAINPHTHRSGEAKWHSDGLGFERSRVRVPAGAAGEFSSLEATFRADSHFDIVPPPCYRSNT